MTYFYSGVASLIGKPLYGDGNCALMVQHYAHLPHSSHWREGGRVVDQTNIWPGTVIATFKAGRYQNNPHNNHVAFFLKFGRRNPNGSWGSFWIVEQFKGFGNMPGSGKIVAREIISMGKDVSGQWYNPSNNADAFSIME